MQKLSGGTVYDLSVHLVLVTKYRRKVINLAMLKRLQVIFAETCQKWDCELKEFNGEDNHCHLLIAINPKAQISALANNLKTVSSRRIRKEFPARCAQFYQKPVFWKIGYFVSSTGGANLETVKQYIQQQDTPA
ncbi:IS200/IS605 family transposase [Myxosarcina sp. GI1]|uniref:IS200/IS605 family transposase n=1 Tax=Myxosarcina sp. GI1 TaxID=1541065 RepID=UPI00056BD7C8|nr:IS200/IS605 family transposase [Myxosarcina sp. GI1]